ncbi:hypothetical protein [Clostridium sp.]|uniref:hypothetical protein n=1 Tax=Clostridium sp. TaxID=1506 RepID=UPI0026369454|nr:hypothetical protein [Clostridium sp.]
MLKWKIRNGNDKLKADIKETKDTFDKWFNNNWAKQITREKMLSKDSPLEHVYYKMTKSFDEIKAKYPLDAKQQCSSCGEYVDKWIETEFSFCNEYGCGMSLCKKCAKDLSKVIDKI